LPVTIDNSNTSTRFYFNYFVTLNKI